MADKKYLSKYSNNKEVTAAQFITELICENKAKKDKKDLHYRFWLNKDWAAFYRNQIATSIKLLEKYSDVAIIKALKDKRTEKIYSLRAPHLIPIIEAEQKKVEEINNTLTINLDRPENIKFNKDNNRIKKNIFSKLKDIDNES